MTAPLFDSNILVYAYLAEASDPRVARAKELVNKALASGNACVGVQNLAEFCSVGLKRGASAEYVADVVRDLGTLETHRPTQATVLGALDGVRRHGLSFWDAMVWSLARENGIDTILTEDLPGQETLDGVGFQNPLV